MELRNVFQAESLSVERVIGHQGRGFYIPSYQRPYAWNSKQAVALVTSVAEGVNSLLQMDDAITFIGTFIFIHDKEYNTVEPQVRPELPPQVYLVIDGQQRLFTLSLMMVYFHDQIGLMSGQIGYEEQDWAWIDRQRQTLNSRLEILLSLDMFYGDFPWRRYPRIIRAHEDSWGLGKETASYSSAVAQPLAAYVHHLFAPEGEKKTKFTFPSPRDEKDKLVADNYKALSRAIQRLVKQKEGRNEDDFLPELGEMLGNPEIQRRFLEQELTPRLRADAISGDSKQAVRLQEYIRLIVLCRYLLERVAVTQVLVNKEDYAFDMFEALNTTGEPLTAYETFKPLVIKAEKLALFAKSESAEQLRHVEVFLDKNSDKRQQASNRLLIPFALYEEGYKLSKHLRDQRNWLRRKYEDLGGKDEQLKFLNGLRTVADFLSSIWVEEDKVDLDFFGTEPDRARTMMCVQVLRAANHHIPVALLARFSQAVVAARSREDKNFAILEFGSALKAVTAFFALWRGSRIGTDNIDSIYRGLMSRSHDLCGVSPFNRLGELPSSDDLKRVLRAHLAKGNIDISDSTPWVQKASVLPVHQQSVPLTKLILLAATHDSTVDPGKPGFLKDGKEGLLPMLTIGMWNQEQQVEHVAPQTATAEWDRTLYANELIHTLGNLTILPRQENQSMQNRSWKVKSLYFRVLASDENLVDEMLVEAKSQGVELSRPSQMILQQAKYVPYVKSLSLLPFEHEWTPEFVRARSEHLAERAWRQFSSWLA